MNKIAKLTAFGEDRYEESDWQDSVPGGKADKKTPMDFDPEKLSEGLKVELEHTDDRKLALEIAMDHLTEDEDYYRKLKKIEKKASVRMPSPRALSGFADELTKVATLTDILDHIGRSMAAPVAKVTRVLFTPIPFTPRLSAPILSQGQLDQLESAIAGSIREHGLIYTGLKGLGVDELLQKAEPILGKKGVPKAVEETFGDRKIWSIANRPIATIADQAVNFLPFGGGWAAKTIAPITYLAEKARIISPTPVYPGDVPYYGLKRKAENLFNPVLEDLGMKTLDLSKRAEDMQIQSMQPDYGHGRGLKKKRPAMRKRAQDDVQDSIAEMLAQAQSQIGTQQPFWGGEQNTFWADQGSTDQSNISDTFYGHGRGLSRKQVNAIKKTASLLLGRRY